MADERRTRQREAVVRELAAADAFRSAQQVYAGLLAAGERVGLATVYRSLAALVAAGGACAVRTAAGELLYRSCPSRQRHQHLVCRRCGAAVELPARTFESWARRAAARNGYAELEQRVELFGTCPRCALDR